ncbi:hypothetical protein ACSMDC_12175 [Yersinia enterocolitica]|uniref:hypothetical protein n=1 Tax=Yersinia enterocolitica TaxID=630 RepID=UPI0028BB7B10|nr:hypothetical protein [Yersinia enterocolitica]HDL7358343.1 hypothetical protein [Yersinia enterocolitica]HDM8090921.1 hypothetical protein [Yersinia enterocolitica]
MEKELLANGFTEKEVNRLKNFLTAEYSNEGDTLESLILDLKKRFIPSCFCILLVLLLYPLIVTKPVLIEVSVYLVIAIFSFFCINLITPMKLSFKAYRFLKNKNKGE